MSEARETSTGVDCGRHGCSGCCARRRHRGGGAHRRRREPRAGGAGDAAAARQRDAFGAGPVRDRPQTGEPQEREEIQDPSARPCRTLTQLAARGPARSHDQGVRKRSSALMETCRRAQKIRTTPGCSRRARGGKTAIVEGRRTLIKRFDQCPDALKDHRRAVADYGAVIAGTKVPWPVREPVQAIIKRRCAEPEHHPVHR